jgi:membrane associated rhomboid family serine protease
VFPYRDSEPTLRTPWITRAVVVFTVAVYLFQLTLDEESTRGLYYACGIVPARWFDPAWARSFGLEPRDAWPLVTSMFLHGNLLHVISNLWALWIFGDNIEDRIGPLRFLAFYVACGAISGAVHAATQPHSAVPTIGASGAIAGVMGAYFVLFPTARVLTIFPVICFPLFLELPAFVYLGLWFVLQVWSGAQSLGFDHSAGGIAWWAHVGGFLAGIALLGLLGRRRTKRRGG